MELHQVRYFLEVSSERNFTKAARKCGISQPSLTRAIKLLEKEFGGELFGRRAGRVDLTELGKLILPYLQNLWEQASTVKKLVSDVRVRNQAQVRVGVMCTIAPKLLIETLASFRSRHSDTYLEIVDGTAEELEEQLLEANLEVAIFSRPRRGPNPRLNYFKLFREQMMIVVPTTHEFASLRGVRSAELCREGYVARSSCEFAENTGNELDGVFASWKTTYQSDRDDWVLAMIASGFGYGFFPLYSAQNQDLAVIPLVEPEFWRDVNLTTVIGRPHSAAVGAFVHEAMRSTWPKSKD